MPLCNAIMYSGTHFCWIAIWRSHQVQLLKASFSYFFVRWESRNTFLYFWRFFRIFAFFVVVVRCCSLLFVVVCISGRKIDRRRYTFDICMQRRTRLISDWCRVENQLVYARLIVSHLKKRLRYFGFHAPSCARKKKRILNPLLFMSRNRRGVSYNLVCRSVT